MRFLLILLLLFFIFPPGWLRAEDLVIGGHLKYQLTHEKHPSDSLQSMFGSSTVTNHEIDLRFNAELYWKDFEFVIHDEILGFGGDGMAARREIVQQTELRSSEGSVLPNDNTRLLDFTVEIADEEKFEMVNRLDRLSAAYLAESFVARVGRQAITWGNGLVFQAFDLFNPFSPTEIDKDYKTGDDMVYAQWLFPTGDDLQGLIVPRRNEETDSIESVSSSYALKWHGSIHETDYDLLAARHYDESVFGTGATRDYFGAVWRLDLTLVDLHEGGTKVTVTANVDRSWVLFEKNIYGYLEYFRSGTGIGDGDYSSISEPLIERIRRGEVFTLGRDYLATGFRLEWNPLLNTFGNFIWNLHDESGIIQFRGDVDAMENLLVMTGIDLPYGPVGSEFGGIRDQETNSVLAAPVAGYVRIAYFF